jgi:hypothetical protein
VSCSLSSINFIALTIQRSLVRTNSATGNKVITFQQESQAHHRLEGSTSESVHRQTIVGVIANGDDTSIPRFRENNLESGSYPTDQPDSSGSTNDNNAHSARGKLQKQQLERLEIGEDNRGYIGLVNVSETQRIDQRISDVRTGKNVKGAIGIVMNANLDNLLD